MKNLLLFLLLAAIAGLFFHDKQQTADLAKEQDMNAQLTQQVATYQAALGQLQQQTRQLNAQMGAETRPFQPQGGGAGASLPQGSGNPLDRPAYH